MSDNILSHHEMCRREGVSLQRGMNFGLGRNHSVILMSMRPNAPYRDRLEDGGTTLIYEGHDHPKTAACPNPKVVNQPGALPSGRLTQNGKFYEAAQHYVYKFKLVAVEGEEDLAQPVHIDAERRRIIPTAVKLEVWKQEAPNVGFVRQRMNCTLIISFHSQKAELH